MHVLFLETTSLNLGIVWNWCQGLNASVLKSVCISWTNRESLQLHGLTLLLGFFSSSCVVLDSVEEFVSRFGFLDVLDSDVDSLLDISVADFLVDDDTNGGFCDVVDNTSLAVVDLVRHTLLDSTVYDNINDVANPSRSR